MTGTACFGFWTCAALYAAIGVIGAFFIGAQPSIAYSRDGYGTIGGLAKREAATRALVTPQRLDAPTPPGASAGH